MFEFRDSHEFVPLKILLAYMFTLNKILKRRKGQAQNLKGVIGNSSIHKRNLQEIHYDRTLQAILIY